LSTQRIRRLRGCRDARHGNLAGGERHRRRSGDAPFAQQHRPLRGDTMVEAASYAGEEVILCEYPSRAY